jgi:hypothetical protein
MFDVLNRTVKKIYSISSSIEATLQKCVIGFGWQSLNVEIHLEPHKAEYVRVLFEDANKTKTTVYFDRRSVVTNVTRAQALSTVIGDPPYSNSAPSSSNSQQQHHPTTSSTGAAPVRVSSKNSAAHKRKLGLIDSDEEESASRLIDSIATVPESNFGMEVSLDSIKQQYGVHVGVQEDDMKFPAAEMSDSAGYEKGAPLSVKYDYLYGGLSKPEQRVMKFKVFSPAITSSAKLDDKGSVENLCIDLDVWVMSGLSDRAELCINVSDVLHRILVALLTQSDAAEKFSVWLPTHVQIDRVKYSKGDAAAFLFK